MLCGRALAGECTAEEGAQEGVQHGRHSIDINCTQGEVGSGGGRGASVLAIENRKSRRAPRSRSRSRSRLRSRSRFRCWLMSWTVPVARDEMRNTSGL